MNFDLGKSMAILERTPGVLRALLTDLPDDWTRGNEGPDTWSPFDVVGHLIVAEETDWMPRARVILAQGPDRRFPPFDRFRHLRENQGKSLGTLLDRFAELRARSLADLAALDVGPRELAFTGEHPGWVRTLAQLLATWVAHDPHLAQAARQRRTPRGPRVLAGPLTGSDR
jgi:hypothetical protein